MKMTREERKKIIAAAIKETHAGNIPKELLLNVLTGMTVEEARNEQKIKNDRCSGQTKSPH